MNVVMHMCGVVPHCIVLFFFFWNTKALFKISKFKVVLYFLNSVFLLLNSFIGN